MNAVLSPVQFSPVVVGEQQKCIMICSNHGRHLSLPPPLAQFLSLCLCRATEWPVELIHRCSTFHWFCCGVGHGRQRDARTLKSNTSSQQWNEKHFNEDPQKSANELIRERVQIISEVFRNPREVSLNNLSAVPFADCMAIIYNSLPTWNQPPPHAAHHHLTSSSQV